MCNSFIIRPAQLTDVHAIARCVKAAYQPYIARIGKPPGPMLDDYAAIIKKHSVWVICDSTDDDKSVLGLLVLMEEEDHILLDNIAIHPAAQGQGLGKKLMAFAESEAFRRGFEEVHLYTHIKMTENIAIYKKLGYIETERRMEKGYERVYMKKGLG